MIDFLCDPGNPKFMVISQLDGRAIEGADDKSGILMELDETNPKQQWIQTEVGNQWINVGTGYLYRVGAILRVSSCLWMTRIGSWMPGTQAKP